MILRHTASLAALAILAGAALADEPVVPLQFIAQGEVLSVQSGSIERAVHVFVSGSTAAGVEITFSEDMNALLAAFTTRHVGQVVDILFCGDILVSPQIRDPMISGRVLVPLATVERAASVAQRLGSDAPCSDDGAG